MCSRGKSSKNNVVLPNYISDSDTSDGENGVEKIVINIYSNLAWNTFQRYSKINYKVWCITIPDDGSNGNWKNGSCNCPHFMKNYICKHLVGLAMRLKYIKVPAAAKDVPIGEKMESVVVQPKHCKLL